MTAKLTLGKGYAAGAAFGIPYSGAAATGTLSRGTPAPTLPGPTPQSLPVDPSYDAATGNAQRNLALTQAGLAYQRQQLGSTYGLGINGAGVVIDDPSNPYSRAAALQESYRRSQAGSTTSMAARGQLYSGALQNEQNENANVNSRQRDALIRQFLGENQGLQQRELQAASDYQGALTQAGSDRIMRALAARPDPAVVPQTTTNLISVLPKPKAKAKTKAKK